jgi:competence protein ComFC
MSGLADAALALLFPQRLCCHGCGCALREDEGALCAECQKALNRCTYLRKDAELLFRGEQLLTVAVYRYQGMAAGLVRSLKYGSDKAAAVPLAEGMARRFAQMEPLRAAELCVAVPSYPRQAQRRGYGQAQVLCEAFAATTGLRYAQYALTRVRYAKSQVGAGREERKKSIVGAFALDTVESRAVADRCVLLIDDVLTTGATACECARVLYAAGARRVLALTACRA